LSSRVVVTTPGEADRELVLGPGSSVEPVPSILLTAAEVPGVVVEGGPGGSPVTFRGRNLAAGERRLLRPGESARVGAVTIVARADDPGTAAQARAVLLAALRDEAPDGGAGIDVVEGPEAGRRLGLRAGVLGRGETADLRLRDPSVSRRHARVRVDGERVLLEDLGSRNGLWLGRSRIRTLRELRPGDEVRAGRTVLAIGVARPPDPVPVPLPPPGIGRQRGPRLVRVALALALAAAVSAAALALWS
jgi:hypothetical protein